MKSAKISLILFVVMSFTVTLLAQKKEAETTKWNIDNCVNRFSPDKISPTKVGYQYWFVDKDFANGRTLKMSVVKPHSATHPPHKHVEDEFFFVLEGTAMVYLNGDSTVCSAYSSFYCPSMIEHGIRNAGDTELKYLVIKDYPNEKEGDKK